MYWCVMDFYVLKKDDELKAIPADKAACQRYEELGYSYIDKVAACTEQAAIKKLKVKSLKILVWPIIRVVVVAIAVAAIWLLS